MKELFAALYENDFFGIYSQKYPLIFQTLFDGGGYVKLGLTFILIPLAFWFCFYFLWRHPYGNYKHWLFWLLVTTMVVYAATIGIARVEIFASSNPQLINAMANPASGYEAYSFSLPGKYGLINGILSLVVSSVSSLVMKQFSKIQAHLPI